MNSSGFVFRKFLQDFSENLSFKVSTGVAFLVFHQKFLLIVFLENHFKVRPRISLGSLWDSWSSFFWNSFMAPFFNFSKSFCHVLPRVVLRTSSRIRYWDSFEWCFCKPLSRLFLESSNNPFWGCSRNFFWKSSSIFFFLKFLQRCFRKSFTREFFRSFLSTFYKSLFWASSRSIFWNSLWESSRIFFSNRPGVDYNNPPGSTHLSLSGIPELIPTKLLGMWASVGIFNEPFYQILKKILGRKL